MSTGICLYSIWCITFTKSEMMFTCCHGRRLQVAPHALLQQECCSLSSGTRVNSPVECPDDAAPCAATSGSGH